MTGLRDPDTNPPRGSLLPYPALPTLRAGTGLASAAATLRCPWSRRGGRCRSQPCGGSSATAPAGPGLRSGCHEADRRVGLGRGGWRGRVAGGAALAHSGRATDVYGMEGQLSGVGHRVALGEGFQGMRGVGWGGQGVRVWPFSWGEQAPKGALGPSWDRPALPVAGVVKNKREWGEQGSLVSLHLQLPLPLLPAFLSQFPFGETEEERLR